MSLPSLHLSLLGKLLPVGLFLSQMAAADRWYLGNYDESCTQLCIRKDNQSCTEEGLFLNNVEVSSPEAMNWTVTEFSGASCGSFETDPHGGPDVPVLISGLSSRCYWSKPDRKIGSFDCNFQPEPGKQRFCYCNGIKTRAPSSANPFTPPPTAPTPAPPTPVVAVPTPSPSATSPTESSPTGAPTASSPTDTAPTDTAPTDTAPTDTSPTDTAPTTVDSPTASSPTTEALPPTDDGPPTPPTPPTLHPTNPPSHNSPAGHIDVGSDSSLAYVPYVTVGAVLAFVACLFGTYKYLRWRKMKEHNLLAAPLYEGEMDNLEEYVEAADSFRDLRKTRTE